MNVSQILVTSRLLEYEEGLNAARDIVARLRATGRQFVRDRFELGRIMAAIKPVYGESTMSRLAEDLGIHENTLRECRRFFESFPGGARELETWMRDYDDIHWLHAQRRIGSRCAPEILGTEQFITSITRRLERDGQDLATLKEVLDRADVDESLREEALTVAQSFVEEVRTLDLSPFVKEIAPRSHQYLAWVRHQPCTVSGERADVQAHHLEQGSADSKGSDYSCIPLRADLHQELETIGHARFEEKYGVDLRYALLQCLHRFLTGANLTISYGSSIYPR